MWLVKCQSGSELHVEQRARERIIIYLRNFHNIILSEDEVKEKVLELLKTSSNKQQFECDKDINIPKYKLYGILPGTNLTLCLIILENEEDLLREVKTIINSNLMMQDKNIHFERKKKGKRRYQDKIQKKSI